MRIRAITGGSRVEAVETRLRTMIERGDFRVGDRVPSEPILAAKLKVSRTVLREAIGRLQCLGLVEVKKGLGTFVCDTAGVVASSKSLQRVLSISWKDLQTAAEFRRGIEEQAARLASTRATPSELEELELICQEMDAHGKNTLLAMQADFRFHTRIVAITQNPMMINVMSVLYEFIMAGMLRTPIPPLSSIKRSDDHRRIAIAIGSGSPDRAAEAMRMHMDSIEQRLAEFSADSAPSA